MIPSGDKIQILGSDEAQETLGDGELLEKDLALGELMDLGRLGQEEDQPQQVLQVEERGETNPTDKETNN